MFGREAVPLCGQRMRAKMGVAAASFDFAATTTRSYDLVQTLLPVINLPLLSRYCCEPVIVLPESVTV